MYRILVKGNLFSNTQNGYHVARVSHDRSIRLSVKFQIYVFTYYTEYLIIFQNKRQVRGESTIASPGGGFIRKVQAYWYRTLITMSSHFIMDATVIHDGISRMGIDIMSLIRPCILHVFGNDKILIVLA